MSKQSTALSWAALISSISLALLAPMVGELSKPWNYISYSLGGLLFFVAIWLMVARHTDVPASRGGDAGSSESKGGGRATAGNGGSGKGRGMGGSGGNAKASGNGSVANGGKGGDA